MPNQSRDNVPKNIKRSRFYMGNEIFNRVQFLGGHAVLVQVLERWTYLCDCLNSCAYIGAISLAVS